VTCRASTGTGRPPIPAPPLVGDGTWEKILDRLRAGYDQGEGEAWTATIDATVVRAHQHAAGPGTQPPKDIDPGRLAVGVLSVPVCRGG
jgi:hypothetical protein